MARNKVFSKSCEIHFLPEQFDLVHSLPPAASKLASLLSQTLGSGKNEGTLRPTARLKREAEQSWTNLLLRPWADMYPYNSRKAVDRGLARWAGRGKAYDRVHLRIMRQLPKAEQAVAELYRKSFKMSADEARQQAATNIDRVYRSYYVFPEGINEARQSAD